MTNYQHSLLPFFKLMKVYIPIIRDLHQRYISNLEEQIMAIFFIKFKGTITWNSLPVEIRNISSFTTFKTKLKEYVQDHLS